MPEADGPDIVVELDSEALNSVDPLIRPLRQISWFQRSSDTRRNGYLNDCVMSMTLKAASRFRPCENSASHMRGAKILEISGSLIELRQYFRTLPLRA